MRLPGSCLPVVLQQPRFRLLRHLPSSPLKIFKVRKPGEEAPEPAQTAPSQTPSQPAEPEPQAGFSESSLRQSRFAIICLFFDGCAKLLHAACLQGAGM